MGYGNSYSNEVELMEDHQFCRTRTLNELCDNLSGIKFALQTDRTKAIDIISKLVKVYGGDIFDKNKRFPDKGSFIDLHSNDWPDKLDQILTAANYKPPENAFIVGNTSDNKNSTARASASAAARTGNTSAAANNSEANEDARNIVDPSERQKFEKALKSFFTGITAIRNQIGSRVGVYNQRHFENHFSLTWS